MSAAKTIVLVGQGTRQEAIANAAITPGHLIDLMSTSKVRVHPVAGGNAIPAFAVEDDTQGRSIDTAYAAGELVQYNIMRPGEMVNAILKDGETVVVGDFLESAGDGTFQKHVPDTESLGADSSANINTFYSNQIILQAKEALDLSDSSGADPASARIACMVFIRSE